MSVSSSQAISAKCREKWKDRGYYIENTEYVVRRGPKTWRKDLFGFVDYVALKLPASTYDGPRMIAIQLTTKDHVNERRDKILYGRTRKTATGTPHALLAWLLTKFGWTVMIDAYEFNEEKWRYENEEHILTKEELYAAI